MLNRLLGKFKPDADEVPFEDLSPEEQAEVLTEEKKTRVKYHREHVRNGPQRFRYVSTGQQRRRAERDQRALNRKVNKRHRRQWQRDQLDRAVLRGQLQAIGALPYATDHTPTIQARIGAGQWLVRAFGDRDDDGKLILHDDILTDAVKAALEAYEAGA